tara:strand:- start:213 stop:578 length:366 start_codon:yes stop_codon:yes gene_type:complete
MSTLKVGTIQNTSGGASSTPEQIESGRAKAWVRFNQSNNSIQASFNVSSITDVSNAKTDINFATAFADANYTFAGMCGNNNNFMALDTNTQDPSATEVRVASTDAGNSLQDSTDAGVVIFA